MEIGFNKPYLTGNELNYIAQAVASEKISGDGLFTHRCHEFFRERYGFPQVLLTTSCTDALELAALLCDIKAGDEVIAPSFTFVSTVNAFVLRGARIVFADSCKDHPCMDAAHVAALITPKTKVIVAVHYAGVAVDLDPIKELAERHGIFVVEDAAQAVDSYYRGRPLGSIGHFAAFSFHETKNVIAGEGGMLVVNDARFAGRAEILREKGTNRSAFFRGQVDKYTWVDVGSSFLPSDVTAAFLYAQLENLSFIQTKRLAIWRRYDRGLRPQLTDRAGLPTVPAYATNNAHMYYLVCQSLEQRTELIRFLKSRGIQAVFHYVPLHRSPFATSHFPTNNVLPQADRYSDCLVRLPFYFELTDDQVDTVVDEVNRFFA